MPEKSRNLGVLQAAIWLFSAVLFYLQHRIPAYPTAYLLAITLNAFIFFAIIFYGYAWMYRNWYPRMKKAGFILAVFGLLALVVTLRIILENTVVAQATPNIFFRLFYSAEALVTYVHLANAFSSCFFVLLASVMYTSFTESISLRAKQAEIRKQHMEAELNGLKAQVQPHFFFNSLNNLYYDTYKTLPNVAERIAMLSDIMRYFTEESPKTYVPLSTELEFIRDFIQLEQVRIPYPVSVRIDDDIDHKLMLPPMLLIPLVENAFKHGLSASEEGCTIVISLRQEGNRIRFSTRNRKVERKDERGRQGTGLRNLKERLNLLYEDDYRLHTGIEDGNYIAELIIPVYENELRDSGRRA
jgi:sensor histidine kinase YesM